MTARSYLLACAAALAGVVGTCADAAAQQNWVPGVRLSESATRVMGGIREIGKKTNYGYCEGICILSAFLTNGKDVAFNIGLTKGKEYAFIGGGDNGVIDLDITVKDKSGKVVASDVADDAIPQVMFTAPASATFELKVTMAKSEKNGGFATIGLLVKGGYDVPVENLAGALGSMIVQCEDVNKKVNNGGGKLYFASDNNQWGVFGSIVPMGGDSSVNNITPGSGKRVLLSGGDKTTSDLDLVLTDRNGRTIKEDTDDDAYPRVVFDSKADTPYNFKVKNVKSRGASLVLTSLLVIIEN